MPEAMLLGAACGLGLLAILRGVLPYRPPLSRALAELDRPAPPVSRATSELDMLKLRVAKRALILVEQIGLDARRDAADLRIVERAAEEHMLAKLGTAVALGTLPLVFLLLARLGGLDISPVFPVLPALTLAVVGFVLPDLDIRRRAQARREEFRQTLASYLDLVAILLAGGAGTETALYGAAELGHGWGFVQLRLALDRCQLSGDTPWRSLTQLGDEIGVTDLRELAATASWLANRAPAFANRSPPAPSRCVRRNSPSWKPVPGATTEQMTLPMVVLAFAFVLFIGYPAIQQVLGGL